ncbi:hypothetical protein L6Q96_14620 [Candidatus Binatia bacterium]|nr:hypothetical protein [Candidatus Binatia bacterium]
MCSLVPPSRRKGKRTIGGTIGDTHVLREDAGAYPAGLALENDAMGVKSA